MSTDESKLYKFFSFFRHLKFIISMKIFKVKMGLKDPELLRKVENCQRDGQIFFTEFLKMIERKKGRWPTKEEYELFYKLTEENVN